MWWVLCLMVKDLFKSSKMEYMIRNNNFNMISGQENLKRERFNSVTDLGKRLTLEENNELDL